MDEFRTRAIIFRERRLIRKEILRIKRLKPRARVEKITIRRGCKILSI
jgi:hypothetical protein